MSVPANTIIFCHIKFVHTLAAFVWSTFLHPSLLQLRQPARLRSGDASTWPGARLELCSCKPCCGSCVFTAGKKKKKTLTLPRSVTTGPSRSAQPAANRWLSHGPSPSPWKQLSYQLQKENGHVFGSSICVGIIVPSWSDNPLRHQNHNGSKETNRTCFLSLFLWHVQRHERAKVKILLEFQIKNKNNAKPLRSLTSMRAHSSPVWGSYE